MSLQAVLKAYKSQEDHPLGFDVYDISLLKRVLQTMPSEFEVIFRKEKKARSLNQNAYMWGVVYKLIADFTGENEDDIHEILKKKFLGESTIMIGGIEEIIGRSTTKLSTVEFEEYLTKVRAWANEKLEVFIPLPNEVSHE